VRVVNSFEVAAPVDEVWRLLNDVPRVVPCMPGAELTETVDADTWKGRLHVRLGPIALEFGTDVVRQSADEALHRVVLVTKARELRGRGSAQATIESRLSGSGGATKVEVVTEITLQGAVAQYGRGIVPDVASQLTTRFAENVARLIAEGGQGIPATSASDVVPVSGLRLGFRALWSALRRVLGR